MKFIFIILFFISLSSAAQSYSHPAAGDEFVGPFTSWLQTNRTANDSVSDATTYLQNLIDRVGKDNSTHQTVYLKAGTYRITNTLYFDQRFAARIIGAHPDSVKIIWDGGDGGTMLHVYG